MLGCMYDETSGGVSARYLRGMRYLAVDPGASTGWAVFDKGVLMDCGACEHVKVWTSVGNPQGIGAVILEKPQKYPQDNVDPNDLITLAVRAGIAVGPFLVRGASLVEVHPKEWKGQLPKAICHARSVKALSGPEAALYTNRIGPLGTKAKTDMADAVALGQWAYVRGFWTR